MELERYRSILVLQILLLIEDLIVNSFVVLVKVENVVLLIIYV